MWAIPHSIQLSVLIPTSVRLPTNSQSTQSHCLLSTLNLPNLPFVPALQPPFMVVAMPIHGSGCSIRTHWLRSQAILLLLLLMSLIHSMVLTSSDVPIRWMYLLPYLLLLPFG